VFLARIDNNIRFGNRKINSMRDDSPSNMQYPVHFPNQFSPENSW